MAMVEKQSGIKAELIPYKTTDQRSQGDAELKLFADTAEQIGFKPQ